MVKATALMHLDGPVCVHEAASSAYDPTPLAAVAMKVWQTCVQLDAFRNHETCCWHTSRRCIALTIIERRRS